MFEARNTGETAPARIYKQYITFASDKGATIGVSDNEMTGVTATYGEDAYTFKPNYLNNQTMATGATTLLLNSEGSSFTETEAPTVAFRPYFTASAINGAREMTRSILFSRNETEMTHKDNESHDDVNEPGTLIISTESKKILVTSALKYTVDVAIVSPSGVAFNTFTLQPGETIETRLNLAGVYIVKTTDNSFTRKVSVK